MLCQSKYWENSGAGGSQGWPWVGSRRPRHSRQPPQANASVPLRDIRLNRAFLHKHVTYWTTVVRRTPAMMYIRGVSKEAH